MTFPCILVASGPTATCSNSAPLITSQKARAKYGLPPREVPDDQRAPRFDMLRPQRLAAPVTVYVEQFSAHPLERDVKELYAPPDGWLTGKGVFTETEPDDADAKPVYKVTLDPEDGLMPLPFYGRRRSGQAWEQATVSDTGGIDTLRQTFFPDFSRIYEDIDRGLCGIHVEGGAPALSTVADYDFIRAAPSGGYTKGCPAEQRHDIGKGDVPPETLSEDFALYSPHRFLTEPTLAQLAHATNAVQTALDSKTYAGIQWQEGSPTIEETLYWLGLLIDIAIPIIGHCSQRAHGTLSADGGRNVCDGVRLITSGVMLDDQGRNQLGAVLIVDELAYTAREVHKLDARPGGMAASGGHGGIVADLGGTGPPEITFLPTHKHTWRSDVRITQLPLQVKSVRGDLDTPGSITMYDLPIKDDKGGLLTDALAFVPIVKYACWSSVVNTNAATLDPRTEIETLSRVRDNLCGGAALGGFVLEGKSPYGLTSPIQTAGLEVAIFSGFPVVRVGRGNTAGRAYSFDKSFIVGQRLTAVKARMLLMACLLKFGALPPAHDPFKPTEIERERTADKVKLYQKVFDEH